MNTSSLETTDIFRGAFFICMGGDLSGIRLRPKATPGQVRFRQNGKQIASFMFTGHDLHKHDREYISGHAMVNPVQFREALNHLRDILFKQLRDNPASPEGYAAARGRTRYDRKRKDREYQARR